jgi:hypothetical protein
MGSAPPLKIDTHRGASRAELERRTYTPEDRGILEGRPDRWTIYADAFREELSIGRRFAHAARRGRTLAQQVMVWIERDIARHPEP